MALKLGRVAGVPVDIDYSWLLILGVFTYTVSVGYFHRNYPWLPGVTYWFLGFLTVLVFFISLLLHESAHSIYTRRNGIHRERVSLFLFGGIEKPDHEPGSPREDFYSAAAGLAVSLSLAAIFWLPSVFTSPGSAINVTLTWLAAANGLVAGFNLLPAFPLDGGRIFRAGLWAGSSDFIKATRVVSVTGQVLGWTMLGAGAVAFAGYGYLNGLWLVFAGWFLVYASAVAYRNLVFRRALYGVGVKSLVTQEVETVDSASTLDELVNAYFLRTYSDVYPVSHEGAVKNVVTLASVRRVPGSKWGNTRVAAVMKPIDSKSFMPVDEDAWQAFERMENEHLDYLFVVDEGKVVGMVKLEEAERSLKSRVQMVGDRLQ